MEKKKNSKMLLIIVIIFALLMGGAYVLYDRLSGSVENKNLVAQGGNRETEAGSESVPTAGESESSVSGTDSETAPSNASSTGSADNQAGSSPDSTDSQTDTSAESTEHQLSLAPDFTVYDGDGNPVSLSDFIGKPVIVNFWASWCGPCKSEMPDFEEAYAEYGDDIHFLMINSTDGSRETVETAKQFIEEQGYTFPVYFDTDYLASYTYGVSGIPMTFFIDAEGYAVAYASGMLDRETLQVGIEMIYPPQ